MRISDWSADVCSSDLGCIRPDTALEALAELKPAFATDGSVNAATSSPLTDGASAVLVPSEGYAHAHGLTPLARQKSIAVAGCAPDVLGLRPEARRVGKECVSKCISRWLQYYYKTKK